MGIISIQKLQTETENLLRNIGFIYSRYSFQDIIPYNDLRKKISSFDTDSAKILIHSPDYFIMPSELRGSSQERQEKAKNQIFFVKTLIANTLTKEEDYIYKKYYKPENIIIIAVHGGRVFVAKYLETRTSVSRKYIKLSFPKKGIHEFFSEMKLPVTTTMIKKNIDDFTTKVLE